MGEYAITYYAAEHLDRLPNADKEEVYEVAGQLAVNGSRASREITAPSIYQIIPITTSDSELLWGALTVIESDVSAGDATLPSETILNINTSRGSGKSSELALRETTDLVRDFQHDYPTMPLTFFTREYFVGTTISKLRGHATDGMLAYRFGDIAGSLTEPQRVLVIAQDVDMTWRSPNYPSVMYNKLVADDRALAVRGMVRYAETGLPKIDSIIKLDTLFVNLGFRFIEAGVGFDLGEYCRSNGYDVNVSLGETTELVRGFPNFTPGRSIVNAPEAVIETSNHRLVLGMTGDQPESPWEIDLDIVVDERNARRRQPVDLNRDISDEQYRLWVEGFRQSILTGGSPSRYRRAIQEGKDHKAALQTVFNLVREVQHHTKNLDGIPELATKVGEEMACDALRRRNIEV